MSYMYNLYVLVRLDVSESICKSVHLFLNSTYNTVNISNGLLNSLKSRCKNCDIEIVELKWNWDLMVHTRCSDEKSLYVLYLSFGVGQNLKDLLIVFYKCIIFSFLIPSI